MSLGTLGVSLLGKILTRKETLRTGYGNKERKRNAKSWLWI